MTLEQATIERLQHDALAAAQECRGGVSTPTMIVIELVPQLLRLLAVDLRLDRVLQEADDAERTHRTPDVIRASRHAVAAAVASRDRALRQLCELVGGGGGQGDSDQTEVAPARSGE